MDRGSPEAGAYFRLLLTWMPHAISRTPQQFPIPHPQARRRQRRSGTAHSHAVVPLRQALCISLKATNLLGLPPVARLLL